MAITIKSEPNNENFLMIFVSGRLDTASAAELDTEFKQLIDGTIDIILDLNDLSYISSSGLHVLLQTYKLMDANKRKLVIKNIGDAVRDVFVMTGFISLIAQEE